MKNARNAIYDLPEDGLIYVDGSGIKFTYGMERSISSIGNSKSTIEFLSGFNQVIKSRRGGVSTVVPVLNEIENGLKRYKNLMDHIKYNKNKNQRNQGNGTSYVGRGIFAREEGEFLSIDETNTMFHLARKGRKEFGRLCATLREGIDEYNLPEDSDTSRERSIVYGFDGHIFHSGKPLSLPDKELVIEALASGGGNGILSADIPMIRVYTTGVRKLGLEGCFVCHSLKGRSYFIE